MSRDALIVGINKYRHINSLKASANDAEAVAQRLESQFRVRRFPESFNEDKQPVVASSQEVSVTTLEEAIADLFLPDGKDIPETALFYFSGHGLRKPSRPKRGFLATSDTDPRVNNWGIDLKWLREVLSDSPIRHQIVWLDVAIAVSCLIVGMLIQAIAVMEKADVFYRHPDPLRSPTKILKIHCRASSLSRSLPI